MADPPLVFSFGVDTSLPASTTTTKPSSKMPPKQSKAKAAQIYSDSTYEESAPEPANKPRISLKRGRINPNMAQEATPMQTRAVVRQPSQDPIYEELLSRPDEERPATKKQQVSKGSDASSATVGKSHQDLFNAYTRNLVIAEINEQANALDFSRDGGLPDQARVYGQYLFTAPGQSKVTKTLWLEKAMSKVDSMSMADIRNGGISAAVKRALLETITEETGNQAALFARSAKAIMNKVREED